MGRNEISDQRCWVQERGKIYNLLTTFFTFCCGLFVIARDAGRSGWRRGPISAAAAAALFSTGLLNHKFIARLTKIVKHDSAMYRFKV